MGQLELSFPPCFHKWKSREAYSNRLYYSGQLSSKLSYANDRYWELKRKLDKLYRKKYLKLIYNGQPTKMATKKIERLEKEMEYWDELRWRFDNLPLSMRKFVK